MSLSNNFYLTQLINPQEQVKEKKKKLDFKESV